MEWLILLLIPAWAIHDRLAGWHGVFDYVGAIGLGLLTWWIGERYGWRYDAGILHHLTGLELPVLPVLLALAEVIYRNPGWAIHGGALDPTKQQLQGTFLRHLLAMVFLVPLVAQWWIAWPLLSFYAGAATALGRWINTERKHGRQVNWKAELIRGACRGAAIAVPLLLRPPI